MGTRVLSTTLVVLCLSGCLSSWRSGGTLRSTYRPPTSPNTSLVPKDTTFDVKLNTTLDSGTRDVRVNREGDLFAATVVMGVPGRIPNGAIVKGRIDDIKHTINRTSMKLRFYELSLPDGRHAAITATPKSGSKIKMDELKEGGTKIAKDFLIEKGIDVFTAGLLAPLWVARKVAKGYAFVTKEERMILPEGSTMTIKLRADAYIPRR